MCSFEIYDKWPVQTSIDTHTLPQCSHASVGLAQARPNYAQKNAWVDSEIFADWFHKEFVPAVKHLSGKSLPVKALLLLDNAPAHPDESVLISSDKSIKAVFLPPNTTALIQPMDQGVLKSLKQHYHKSLLRKLLLLDEEGDSMITFVKKINVKDAIYMTAVAWDDIPSFTLSKSWLKLLLKSSRCG